MLAVSPGDSVRAGDLLGTVHALDERGGVAGEAALRAAVRIGEGEAFLRPLVSHRVSAEGVTRYGGGVAEPGGQGR
ncbi:hypothetical protein [Thermoflexus hugenholtzii]